MGNISKSFVREITQSSKLELNLLNVYEVILILILKRPYFAVLKIGFEHFDQL